MSREELDHTDLNTTHISSTHTCIRAYAQIQGFPMDDRKAELNHLGCETEIHGHSKFICEVIVECTSAQM